MDDDWAGAVLKLGPSTCRTLAARPGCLRRPRRTMPVRERRRRDPGIERCFIAPAGDDEPSGPVVGRFEELESLEPVLVVHRAGPRPEAMGQLVAAVLRDGDGVDLDDGHWSMVAPTLTSSAGQTLRRSTQGRAAPVTFPGMTDEPTPLNHLAEPTGCEGRCLGLREDGDAHSCSTATRSNAH